MTPVERRLRNLLLFQGFLSLAMNLWAMLGTRSFLSSSNPSGDPFEARSFAALSLVMAVFFFAGAWRKDLLRPACFLGLGSSAALALVELFHVPALGWTMLWLDLILQIAIAGLYIAFFFFRRDETVVVPAVVRPEQTQHGMPEEMLLDETQEEDLKQE